MRTLSEEEELERRGSDVGSGVRIAHISRERSEKEKQQQLDRQQLSILHDPDKAQPPPPPPGSWS